MDLVMSQVYANVQIVLIPDRSAREVERKWELVWGACKKWAKNRSHVYGKERQKNKTTSHHN